MSFCLGRISRKAAALIAAAFCVSAPITVFAHDPGLSSLDVSVDADRIIVTLSLSAADVKPVADIFSGNPEALALAQIEILMDGVRLAGVVDGRAQVDDRGTRVRISFARGPGQRLTVRSRVSGRLALGHRELLTIRSEDGRLHTERMLDAQSEPVTISLDAVRQRTGSSAQFFSLGVRHILGGYDHLLFLAALLLGVGRAAAIAKTVTAFTVAHSVTLALAVLGIVRAPAAVVEPLIALSIVFVGLENLLRDQVDSRWKTTFAFGLVHGFGFATALQELGIGSGSIGVVTPLASFNAGVETGQLAIAMLLWPLIKGLNARPVLRLRVSPVLSALVVVAGAYWLAQRMSP
jgi:hydrogenase/urease accessory protein HupE